MLSTFLNPNIPALRPTDSVAKALQVAERSLQSNLPVVSSDNTFLGFIKIELLENIPETEEPIGALHLHGVQQKLPESAHYLDVLITAPDADLPMVAILDKQQQYIGVVTNSTIAAHIGSSLSQTGKGGVIVLKLEANDYSLSEISRLAESDNVKIMASFVEPHPSDPYTLLLTLKMATNQLQRTIATYERFGYQIVGSYNVANQGLAHTDRVGFLMRYLEI